MKKLLCIILTVAFILFLTACAPTSENLSEDEQYAIDEQAKDAQSDSVIVLPKDHF